MPKKLGKSKQVKKKKNTVIAYLDAEFLCDRVKRRAQYDLASVGIVIADANGQEMKRYYSLVRPMPGHKVTPQIRNLTGLTDEMLKDAPLYGTVMHELFLLCDSFKVDSICTWGNDLAMFMKDYTQRAPKPPVREEVKKLFNMFCDIQKEVSSKVTMGIDSGLGLKDLKIITGISGNVSHNALDDAVDLYNSIKRIDEGIISVPGDELAEYKRYLREYKLSRKFKGEEDRGLITLSESGMKFLEELLASGFATEARTKAFLDDLKFIAGGIDDDGPDKKWFK